jgi:hypothetical protein
LAQVVLQILLVLTLYFPQSPHQVVVVVKAQVMLLMVGQAAAVTMNQPQVAQVQ